MFWPLRVRSLPFAALQMHALYPSFREAMLWLEVLKHIFKLLLSIVSHFDLESSISVNIFVFSRVDHNIWKSLPCGVFKYHFVLDVPSLTHCIRFMTIISTSLNCFEYDFIQDCVDISVLTAKNEAFHPWKKHYIFFSDGSH